MKTTIVAISAKNIHKDLAPWCIKAYAEHHLRGCEIDVLESNVNENLYTIVGALYRNSPDVAAFSCYIWNIGQIIKIAGILKKVLPECILVLGGPEVSFEEDFSNYPWADYILQGAGEVTFCDLIQSLASGAKPMNRMIRAQCTDFKDFPSPFTQEYFASFAVGTMSHIKNQLIYYESTRGCPFFCSYCLSSSTSGVQALPFSRVEKEINQLIGHGARCIKFVDRTFNADKERALRILAFIASIDTSCTFHFEAAADLFDDRLLDVIAKIPHGRVQFEIGIQSTYPASLDAVDRKTDIDEALSNIQKLIALKNCHTHVDLIAGLPYETLRSFISGIDRVLQIRPHMLQLGFLKILKGSQLWHKRSSYGYAFAEFPPYEVLQSETMAFHEIMQLKEVEAIVDKFYNSGMYANSLQYALRHLFTSGYNLFLQLSSYCKQNGGIRTTLKNTYTLLMHFLMPYGNEEEIRHYIKLDCLSCDAKGVLPDGIPAYRDKEAEIKIKRSTLYTNVRVEAFPYDHTKRVFIYDIKDPISNQYFMYEL